MGGYWEAEREGRWYRKFDWTDVAPATNLEQVRPAVGLAADVFGRVEICHQLSRGVSAAE